LGIDRGSSIGYSASIGGVRATSQALNCFVDNYVQNKSASFSDEDRKNTMDK